MKQPERRIWTGIFLVIILLLIIFARPAESREVTVRGTEGTQTWNLAESWEDRAEFRALYGPQIGHCLERADYAVTLFKERESGTSEAAHLAEVKANYERTKGEPQGAVGYHVYVDFQRMVRDIHRRDSGGYVWTNEHVVWEREVWWCAFD